MIWNPVAILGEERQHRQHSLALSGFALDSFSMWYFPKSPPLIIIFHFYLNKTLEKTNFSYTHNSLQRQLNYFPVILCTNSSAPFLQSISSYIWADRLCQVSFLNVPWIPERTEVASWQRQEWHGPRWLPYLSPSTPLQCAKINYFSLKYVPMCNLSPFGCLWFPSSWRSSENLKFGSILV